VSLEGKSKILDRLVHLLPKVLYPTEGKLRKMSAQDMRKMPPRLKGYMRASEGVERAREKKVAIATTYSREKKVQTHPYLWVGNAWQ
jgi:hypothetical protein